MSLSALADSNSQSQVDSEVTVPISVAERDTGLSKDALRVWERRYGFPSPARNAHGERVYPAEQVEKLRVLKRLIDRGFRPSHLVPLPVPELQAMLAQSADISPAPVSPEIAAVMALLRAGDFAGIKRHMKVLLAEHRLERFVVEIGAPLLDQVRVEWSRGELEIYQERGLAQALSVLLRQAISSIPPGAESPQVLLTTFPDEPHGLGLIMDEAILTMHGAACISLGAQLPLRDIVMASTRLHVDVVLLSAGSESEADRIVPSLRELRGQLPASIQIWVNGRRSGLARNQVVEGVLMLPTLEEISSAVMRWRESARPPASAALVRPQQDAAQPN